MSNVDRGLLLRPMNESDIPGVMPIELELFADPWSAHAFLDEIGFNPQCAFYVACSKHSELLGYFGLWWNSKKAKLLKIAVQEGFQQMGIGSELLQQAIAISIEQNAKTIELEVAAGNVHAQRFYEKHGFKKIGLIAEFYERNQEDAILYQMCLGVT